MADEPENVDLRFIAAQLGKVLDGQRELRADVKELQVAMAATRTDVGIVKADVEIIKGDVAALRETQATHGARLNVIDSRLATIERHTGLVKA